MSDFQSWLVNTLAKNAASTPDGTETFRVVQSLASKKITLAAIAAFALASALGTGNAWTAAQQFNGTVKIAGATSGLITVQGAAVAGTWTWTLPTSAGTSGYLLSTDGAGVSSWIVPPSTGLTVGTTAVASGISTRILYNNAGALGEYTISGSGTAVAMATGAALVTPQLGTPASGVLTNCTGLPNAAVLGLGSAALQNIGTSGATVPLLNAANTWASGQVFVAPVLGTPASGALTNCTGLPNASVVGLGTAALVATTSLAQLASANVFTSAVQTVSALTTTSPGWYVQITGDSVARVRVGLNATDVPSIAFGPGSGARDAFIEYLAAGSLRFGAPDAAAPVAQIQSQQNVVAGTSNTAGANRTVKGSQGTGTGIGGSLIWQVAPAGSTGTAQNALVTALTIDSTKLATFAGNLAIGGTTISATAQLTLSPAAGSNINLSSSTGGVITTSGDIQAGSGFALGWSDALWKRDAANIIAQRNGTTAQFYKIYNTFTDASNYERLEIGAVGNVFYVACAKGGTGTNRNLSLLATATLSLGGNGVEQWDIPTAGNLLAHADNTYDFGAPGATAARSIYAATSILCRGATGGIGYNTGAGGAVTQATSKSTGVTLNKVCGQITMNNASLAGLSQVGFTLTNSAIAATDIVRVTIASGATADSYAVQVDATAAGSCRVSLHNITAATTLSEAVVLNFAVMKAVTS